MSRLDDLRDIEIGQPTSWPAWFVVVAALVLAALLAFGGWQFLVQDQLQMLERERAREGELRNTYNSKKGMVVNLPAYQAQMVEIEQMLAAMVRQLPDSAEVPSLLIDITEAGTQRGLHFVTFDPQQEEVGDFYAVLPIRVEVSGGYHQLAGFISDLARMPRIVTVGDLTISADDSGGLTTSVMLQTYRYLTEEGG